MKQSRRAPRWPIALNALVFPGVGQFFQQRYIKGVLIIIGFLAGAFVFFYKAVDILQTYYSLMDFEAKVPDEVHGVKGLLGGFGVCVLIWFIAIADSIWNANRIRSEDSEGGQVRREPEDAEEGR